MSQHLTYLDLDGDGTAYECVVVRHDQESGDLYFIRTIDMDEIDKKRMRKIITSRDAHRFEMWELLANNTLPNGMNALEMFHQLVKVRTASGQVISPTQGRRGYRPIHAKKPAEEAAPEAAVKKTGSKPAPEKSSSEKPKE
jgi:hypothetical protein